jgi:hypothetical protein
LRIKLDLAFLFFIIVKKYNNAPDPAIRYSPRLELFFLLATPGASAGRSVAAVKNSVLILGAIAAIWGGDLVH